MQVVKTTNGYISGTVIGRLGKEVSIFRGIPYAAPPVGKLRWKPPQPVKNQFRVPKTKDRDED